ncbi:MAG TPA: hypothetical protein V6D14_06705 [Coleofasciculaceae cyanobacterium]|jgi:hypothetical protein
MDNLRERALRDAQFYAALLKDFNSSALVRVFENAKIKETVGESTGIWVHIYSPTKKLANSAIEIFDLLSTLFSINSKYVGLRVFTKGNKDFEFYFAGNPRFVMLLNYSQAIKQSIIWTYKPEFLAKNAVNFSGTPPLTRQIIKELRQQLPDEANKILTLSCVVVAELGFKLTVEITVPSYQAALHLTTNYLSDVLGVVRKFKEIDLVYFFVGLDERDRVCCGRYSTAKLR